MVNLAVGGFDLALKASFVVWVLFGGASHFNGILVDNVLIGFGIAGFVDNVPPESLEKRVDKLTANLGFVIGLVKVGADVALEAFDKIVNYCMSLLMLSRHLS